MNKTIYMILTGLTALTANASEALTVPPSILSCTVMSAVFGYPGSIHSKPSVGATIQIDRMLLKNLASLRFQSSGLELEYPLEGKMVPLSDHEFYYGYGSGRVDECGDVLYTKQTSLVFSNSKNSDLIQAVFEQSNKIDDNCAQRSHSFTDHMELSCKVSHLSADAAQTTQNPNQSMDTQVVGTASMDSGADCQHKAGGGFFARLENKATANAIEQCHSKVVRISDWNTSEIACLATITTTATFQCIPE